MKSLTKVSIIIPSYNTAPIHLDECLAACYRQGFSENEFEIVLIDDGSTNPPRAVYEKWCSSHENILFLEQENSGQSAARNKGVQLAKGRYLCFVDSDDHLLDGVLSAAYEEAEKERLEILYYHGYGAGCDGDVLEGKDFLVKNGWVSGIWCFLLKSEFLRNSAIRFEEGKLCEDGVFAYEIVSAAKRVKKKLNAGGGYFYRLSGDSTQRTQNLARKMKYTEGFLFAATFFNARLSAIPSGDYFVLTKRCRNYYLLFLLFHLLDPDLPKSFVSDCFARMRERGMFPFYGENIVRGMKFRVLHILLNGNFRFAFFRKMLSLEFIFGFVAFIAGAKSYSSKFRKKKSKL